MPELLEKDFEKIRQLVHDRFGISLGPHKRSLVLGRLQKVVRAYGFRSFSEYYDYLLKDQSGEALNTLINRISTNHTYFNREPNHFAFLEEKAIPDLLRRLQSNKKKEVLRIWSAGCSSGEEPYQIAMILIGVLGLLDAKKKSAILATDISEIVLEKAKQGKYSKENLSNLDATFVEKYFAKEDHEKFAVKPFVKELILFRRLNLMRQQFPFKRRFHIIICRNVMIYFDTETKEQLIQKFYNYLEPGGYLMIGHSESLSHHNSYFKYVQPAIYVKED
ncbi:MAG: protein-glutamate O-methyltransferase [Calditrichaeota bacterium]|nr:protein-glutamate O-methyltransferase [Calditrichota bacterium]